MTQVNYNLIGVIIYETTSSNRYLDITIDDCADEIEVDDDGGAGVDIDISAVFKMVDGSVDVFEVLEDGVDFKLCISVIISGSSVIIKGSNTFYVMFCGANVRAGCHLL